MDNHDAQSLAFGLLAASRALVDGVSAGVRARGFGDLRPAHGFAFTRLSAGGATITQLAEHLDVTRQAAAQLVDELMAKGYVERRPHPQDARARLIVLTGRGWAAVQAAEAAIADALGRWEAALGPDRLLALRDGLLRIAPDGPLRPAW
ncbi:MAG TPA: MarR family transcriptional regulator [Streptosporangiaceae bacterium]|nr:MarR family transcriptional regulator [Streptosporangiaceae bacterium]